MFFTLSEFNYFRNNSTAIWRGKPQNESTQRNFIPFMEMLHRYRVLHAGAGAISLLFHCFIESEMEKTQLSAVCMLELVDANILFLSSQKGKCSTAAKWPLCHSGQSFLVPRYFFNAFHST